jgi:hypothetical protein
MSSALLSSHWNKIQQNLFPALNERLGPLSNKQMQLVNAIEMIRFEQFIKPQPKVPGRRAIDRISIAIAFLAKSIYQLSTTEMLIDRLKADIVLRRICGFSRRDQIPDRATFSRAFSEFSLADLLTSAHGMLIQQYYADELVCHASTDATMVEGREKIAKKESTLKKKESKQRGRPKKGEEQASKPKGPTRLEKQSAGMSLQAMLEDLPKQADVGCKRNSQGYTEVWRGYKFHITSGDGQVPLSCILTSASVHDSQVALPLMKMTENRVDYLYDLMDAAYDSRDIRIYSLVAGRKPLIDLNARGIERAPFAPHEAQRYKARSTAERVNGRLKDEFGGRNVYVRGHAKVMAHLMFGILALTSDQLIRFVAT